MSRSVAACPVRSKTRHAAHTRQFQAADHGHPGAFSNLPLAGRFNSHSHEGGFVLNDCFRHARTTAAVDRAPRKQTLVNQDMRHTIAMIGGILAAFPGTVGHPMGILWARFGAKNGPFHESEGSNLFPSRRIGTRNAPSTAFRERF